jgi:hypothetical protein
MKTVIAYSTESTTKKGTFVTGLKAEMKVNDSILGEILSSRVFNIKTGQQVPVGTEYNLDMSKFDVVKYTNTDEETGKESTSFWLTLKGE